MAQQEFRRLEKRLSLLDVYVISTGAMISSGFFLLPGVATSHAGPSVVLAYFLAGLLIMPAMLSQAELATAMPRAGGTYYFLDRTLGPLVGTIGGVGTWLALVLKSAFALIGMGAYAALVVDIPVVETALGFAALFGLLNILGTRESSGFLRVLVGILLVILTFFVVHGLVAVSGSQRSIWPAERFSPFMPNGFDGMLATVGLVFVSYIGLTKVASLAEEVKQPDRNIPLGMVLALATVTVVYVVGVYIMLATLGPEALAASLTPVADAAQAFTEWLPERMGLWLMVAAAIAAFAAMSNAGIMAASRYPLAMARDRIFPSSLARTGRLGTPVSSIVLTVSLLAVFLLLLDVEQVAKLASALQLLLFALINVAVIVMRESHIESYDPGFRSPFYPWIQLIGLFVPLVLVGEMGWLPVVFTATVTALCFGWYSYYAQHRIVRTGALYHVFERLGRRRFAGLEQELRGIMKEKGARAADPFDEVVAHALVMDLEAAPPLPELVAAASGRLAARLGVAADELEDGFGRGLETGATPVTNGAALLHTRVRDIDRSELLLVRTREALAVPTDISGSKAPLVNAVFFLVSDEKEAGRHLRILAQLAGRVEEETFWQDWLHAAHEQELKEILLREERFLSLEIQPTGRTAPLAGRSLRDFSMPEGSLVALIRREGISIVPRGGTILREGDHLTIIGEPAGLRELSERYR